MYIVQTHLPWIYHIPKFSIKFPSSLISSITIIHAKPKYLCSSPPSYLELVQAFCPSDDMGAYLKYLGT